MCKFDDMSFTTRPWSYEPIALPPVVRLSEPAQGSGAGIIPPCRVLVRHLPLADPAVDLLRRSSLLQASSMRDKRCSMMALELNHNFWKP